MANETAKKEPVKKDEVKVAQEAVKKAEELLKKTKQEAIEKEREVMKKTESFASIKELLEASKKLDKYDPRGYKR